MRALLPLMFFMALAGCQGEKSAEPKPDSAKSAIAAIEAIELPVMSASTDRSIYQAKYEQAWQERGPLVRKLFADFPDDPRTAKLMDEYWQSLMKADINKAECDRIVTDIGKARDSSTNADLRHHAAFWSAFYSSYRDRNEIDKVLDHADKFSSEYENDPRGATMYAFASMSGEATLAQMERAFGTLIAKYPSTEDGAFARAMLPLLENVGKPFDFDFKDAVTGKRHTDEMYRGKVLVIDWWATWCGPCIQSLPLMKELHTKYKDKGVEYIGVSMDESVEKGGLEKLRAFVKQNQMDWPQYHLNEDPMFQQRYKVGQIPTVFVVDREGNVVSIDGYRTLERTLEGLAGKG